MSNFNSESMRMNAMGLNTCLRRLCNLMPDSTIEWFVADALAYLVHRQADERTRIAVAGAFSGGKSTLVNGILALEGQDAQATHVAECTHIPTAVRPSEQTRLLTWDGHGNLMEAEKDFEAEFMQITPGYSKEMPRMLQAYFDREWEIVREVRKKKSLHKIEYLDLPGLASTRTSQKRMESIEGGIRSSDGMIYVVKALRGALQPKDQDCLRKSPPDQPVIIALTYMHPPKSGVAEKVSKQASDVLGKRYIGMMIPEYVNSKKMLLPGVDGQKLIDRLQNSTLTAQEKRRSLVCAVREIMDRIEADNTNSIKHVGELINYARGHLETLEKGLKKRPASQPEPESKELPRRNGISRINRTDDRQAHAEIVTTVRNHARKKLLLKTLRLSSSSAIKQCVKETWLPRQRKPAGYITYSEAAELRAHRKHIIETAGYEKRHKWITHARMGECEALYLSILAINYGIISHCTLPEIFTVREDIPAYLELAGKSGLAHAYLLLGDRYYNKQRLFTARHYYEKARELGLPIPPCHTPDDR